MAASSRLIDTSSVSAVDRDRPHASETMLVWPYILENRPESLMWRRCMMLTPEARKRVRKQVIVTANIYQGDVELQISPVVSRDPISPAMCERGRITCRISKKLVDVLRSGPRSTKAEAAVRWSDAEATATTRQSASPAIH